MFNQFHTSLMNDSIIKTCVNGVNWNYWIQHIPLYVEPIQ